LISLLASLIQHNTTVEDFFKEIIFDQDIQVKGKKTSIKVLMTVEFFKQLCQVGIRKKEIPYQNLVELL
jgi:hypothetical protein